MTEQRVGTITHYFSKLHVAAMDVVDDELHVGDKIHIKGHTSDFTQDVIEIQLDHKTVPVAHPGESVGIRVIDHAREHDEVYKVT